MRIDVLTLFPAAFAGPLDVSIIRRARDTGLLDLHVHDVRDHAHDRHRSVDDYPFGGGQGMVMRVDVLVAALEHVAALAPEPPRVLYLTPQGRRLDDRLVRDLATAPRLVLVCGRYEGVDERFVEGWVDAEVSIGDYILTGGELPAMVLVDAVARHIPGALGDEASATDESFASGLLEHPQYTRPASFRGRDVPPVLLGGDHAAIESWRHEQRLLRTAARRPDLLPAEGVDHGVAKAAGVRIRTCRLADDYDAVASLWAAEDALVTAALPATYEALERALARDADLLVVATSGRRLVGAALAGWDGRRGALYTVVVDARHRGRGVGRALLAEIERRLARKGCRAIQGLVPRESPAAAFLEHLGWERSGAEVMTNGI